MFKIAKLEKKLIMKKVSINLITQEQSQYENGKKVSFEKILTLYLLIYLEMIIHLVLI